MACWTPVLRYLREINGTNVYVLRWMISNCSWPSCGVDYFSNQYWLLIRGPKIKMKEQQFVRVLLLRKESGLDLRQIYPLVCKVLVGRG